MPIIQKYVCITPECTFEVIRDSATAEDEITAHLEENHDHELELKIVWQEPQ